MAYVHDKTTLDEFKEWFVPWAWREEAEDDPRVDEIVAEIELRLAEFSGQAWSEAELKRLLKRAVASPSEVA